MRRWLALGASAAAAALAPAARADEDTTKAKAAATSEHAIEEVVITSRKREENLQQTPIALTAQTGVKLEEANVTNLADASRFVPNVSFTKGGAIAGNSSAAVAFIRGVGQSEFVIASDPGVGLYIDGVYHARMMGAAVELMDIERIEVLRGPQGTLFGRNAIGGAINIISAEPRTDEFTSSASVTAGENGHYGFRVGANIPVSEELAVRFTANRRQRGGYVEALQYDDHDFGDDDLIATRISSRFERGGFEGLLALDYGKQQEFGAGWVADKLLAPGLDPGFTHFFPTSHNNTLPGICDNETGQRTDRRCFGPVHETGSPYKSNNKFFEAGTGRAISPYSTVENFGAAFTAKTSIGAATLKSISSWRHLESGFTRSLSHTPLLVFNNHATTYDTDQYSQELQLTGSAAQGRFDWVTGLYYFAENAIQVDDLATSVFLRTDDTFTVTNRSLAALMNGTVHITDALHFTAGIRITDDKKDGKAEAPQFQPTPTSFSATLRSREWTPSANLSYYFTPDLMGYVSYAEGYKVGTFAPRTPAPNLLTRLPESKPEFLTSYEAGVKSDWLEDRLRLNLAAFHGRYDDIQLNFTPAGQPNPIVGNVASAYIRGIELEVQTLITDDLSLTGALGLMDARYTKFDQKPTPFFSKHTLLERTPGYQGSLGLNYTLALPNSASIVLGADWTLMGRHALAADNAGRPFNIQRAWNAGNVSLGYVAPGEKWSFTVYVQNVTDEAYKLSAGDNLRESFALAEALYNRPREIFATIKYNFR